MTKRKAASKKQKIVKKEEFPENKGFNYYLMVIVVVILGYYVFSFLRAKEGTLPITQIGDESQTMAEVHTVAKGEDLWDISEKYYGTGYKWKEIANENEINNPDLILEGQKLVLPNLEQEKDLTVTPSVTPQLIEAEPSTTESQTMHKVVKGESLWTIAEKYFQSGYNWTDIAKANDLKNPSVITEDSELLIPNIEAKTKTATASESSKAISGDSYQIQKGDNLWQIAVRAYGDGYKWSEIAKKNSLKNPGVIIAGQKLSLPR